MGANSMLSLLIVAIACLSCVHGDCTDNNGGCSDYCIDRGDGNTVCSCPCLKQLDVNGLDCVPITPCNVDLTVIMDNSQWTDLGSCLTDGAIGSGGFGPWGFWQNWRDQCSTIIGYFVDEDAGSQWDVGVQLWDTRVIYDNIHDYADTDLSTAITNIMNRAQPGCNGEASYVYYLGWDIENNPGFTNHVYRGPGVRRDAADTTRVALVLVAEAYRIDENDAMTRMQHVMQGMDQIIVVSQKKRTFENADGTPENDAFNKLIACGNASSTSCADYFFIDDTNDLGQNPTETNIKSQIPLEACLPRRLASNPIEANVVCDSIMYIEIPVCLLKGLSFADLRLADNTCTPGGVDNGTHLIIELPFLLCGVQTETDPTTGETLFTQVVQTRPLAGTETMPSVSFTAQCLYPVPVPEEIVLYSGVTQEAPLQDMGTNFYDLTLTLSIQSDFSTSLASSSSVVVTCPVYGRASAAGLSTEYDLRLVTCFATPSSSPTDATSYTLADGPCIRDDTFLYIVESDHSLVEFSFNFFEFAATYKKPASEKLPVYIHCSFTACLTGDTSGVCNPTCSGRRKRYVDDQENVVIKTLGPFMLEDESQSAPKNVELLVASGQVATALAIFDDFVIAIAAGLIVMIVAVLLAMQRRRAMYSNRSDSLQKEYPPNYFQAVLGEKAEEI